MLTAASAGDSRMERCTVAKKYLTGFAAILMIAVSAGGQIRAINNPGGDTVTLPFRIPDGQGNQWMIFGNGMLQMQGPQPVVGHADMLTIDGNQPTITGNFAQRDAKTGEIIFDNMNFGAGTATRRILFDKVDNSIRIVDIFKNPQNQPMLITVDLQSNVNFGITSSTTVADPKHAQNNIGWVGMTPVGRGLVEMYAGKGAKIIPTVDSQPGSNVVQATIQLSIPPGKSAGIMHFLQIVQTPDQGQQFIADLKEGKALTSLPKDIRKIIVNFPSSMGLAGDYEVLRGDEFDVVELHSGDQLKGTLQVQSYKLSTFYGDVELPTDQVIGLINVGEYRPRQLVVTSDGQIFGGQLQQQDIDLQMSSGQIIHVPLAQINRVGYRKRPGESDEWAFTKPFISMRAGDRVEIEMPNTAIQVATRYGMLSLDPSTISSIAFQSDDNRVHEIALTDGSKFAGIVSATEFDVNLATGAAKQAVHFPASAITRIQFAPAPDDVDPMSPKLSLLNDDVMVGTLIGQLKLDTAFDTLQINAPEIRKITHTAPGSSEVQVELWDDTTVSGQLEDPAVHCKLASGIGIDVPVALLSEYDQPLPTPSAPTVDKIKSLVADLSADDWSKRETAQAALESMGPAVLSVLRDLRPTSPPETQDRMDAIAKELTHGEFTFSQGPTTRDQ
ncbi:MAG: hypothetical protein ABSG31_10100 [Tepidisphaeraceae bacterium]